MVIGKLKGGLGNFLFQIASQYSLSLDNNVKYIIDLNRIWEVHSPLSSYEDNILRNVEISNNLICSDNYLYDSLDYKSIPYIKNCAYDGYFQSEKYWEGKKDKILELFKIDKDTLEYLSDRFPEIVNNNNTCSIHVRRSNYLKVNFFNHLGMDYYNKAIDEVGRDKHFVIFSDDIAWCKDNFKDINATFIEGQKDYMDIYLMSLCKDNITANSTFSWWGSYLNMNPNKKVVTPKIWFAHSHSNEDVPPQSWIKII